MRKGVAEASPAEFERLSVEQAWAVLGWSERCASVGLRSGEVGWVAAGARAVLMVQDVVDRRDREVVLELSAYAATKLGRIRDVAEGCLRVPPSAV